MKGRVILIDKPPTAPRWGALVEDGRLIDLVVDPSSAGNSLQLCEPCPGSIYLGKCKSIGPGRGAAFMDIGDGFTAYLRTPDPIRAGETRLIQIMSYPEPGKAPPATDRIVYKGQLVVVTPNVPGVNISRRIKDKEERERLQGYANVAIEHWRQPPKDRLVADVGPLLESAGIVIRSNARGQSFEWIKHDLRQVLQQWFDVLNDPDTQSGHGVRWRDSPVLRTAFTEWSPPSPDRIVHSVYGPFENSDFDIGVLVSERSWISLIEPFDGPDLFDHYGVWDEIERLKSPRSDLPSGAWMAVEATRAMVTVDVNTAGEFGGGAPLTANLEAARELPRQLRLRGLGGQIIIDFAPLKKTDRKRVEEALKAAFRRDPIETTLAGWTPLGNFELQRKRARRPLSELLP